MAAATVTFDYSKFMFVTVNLVAVLMIMAPAAAVRTAGVLDSGASSPEQRLKVVDEGSSSCWESLTQLEACTGELILFFLNGEINLGRNCCEAIRIISHDCWSTILETLGLTTEEGEVVLGYCDGEKTTALYSIDVPNYNA